MARPYDTVLGKRTPGHGQAISQDQQSSFMHANDRLDDRKRTGSASNAVRSRISSLNDQRRTRLIHKSKSRHRSRALQSPSHPAFFYFALPAFKRRSSFLLQPLAVNTPLCKPIFEVGIHALRSAINYSSRDHTHWGRHLLNITAPAQPSRIVRFRHKGYCGVGVWQAET